MSESLFSNSWYRVAALKPRLRSHAQIHRHVYRDAIWYVMQDHASGRFHRFTPAANLVIGLMDGRRDVGQIWAMACAQLGEAAPSQDEVIKLLADLHRADVLLTDVAPDLGEQQRRRRQQARLRIRQYIGNPVSMRIPLFDPERLLTRALPLLRPLLGPLGALLWLAVVGWALALAGLHWQALTHNAADRAFSVENLLLMGLIYPLVKSLHELGHALVTKAGGGEVHEMGVMLLLLMPIPYVDASAANGFADKRQRMLVGAAGMLVELFIAALAMIAWTWLEPGMARAVAWNILLITGLSTLLFNGNPLLRYDGYYVLSDWLEIPNLGQRANAYFSYLVHRHVFGVEGLRSPLGEAGGGVDQHGGAQAPAIERAEGRWLIAYAIASFLYRMVMMVGIVLVIAGKFFFVGMLLAVWSVYTMLLLPLFRQLAALVGGARLRGKRRRALLVSGAACAGVLIVLFGLPAPDSTRSEGVVWAPEQAQVRAQVDGVLEQVLARPDQAVASGQVLFHCADAELDARRNVLAAQRDELRARFESAQSASASASRVQADILTEQLARVEAELDLAQRRAAVLDVRSPGAGRFVPASPASAGGSAVVGVSAVDLPGRLVHRGDLLAWVMDNSEQGVTTVRVIVDQADADLVRHATVRAEIRAAGQVGRVIAARIAREVPGATDDLPSAILSLQGGGRVGLDPSRPGDARALQKLFVFDLELPPGARLDKLGARVHVRFVHAPRALGLQWARDVRNTLLRRFNV